MRRRLGRRLWARTRRRRARARGRRTLRAARRQRGAGQQGCRGARQARTLHPHRRQRREERECRRRAGARRHGQGEPVRELCGHPRCGACARQRRTDAGRDIHPHDPGESHRHLPAHQGGRERHAAQHAERGRRARRHRQHGVGGGLRRTDRPGVVRRVERRRRRAHAARRARAGASRHPRHDDCTRHLHDADDGGGQRGFPRVARSTGALPFAPGPARGIRGARRRYRRQRHAERRDDSPRRRDPDAAEMSGPSHRLAAVAIAVMVLGSCSTTPDAHMDKSSADTATTGLQVPVDYHKLDNGLKVVISEDHTVPIATVGVYYHIGFRIEPRGRTGFAHLFEHMMFQGSANLGKMEFIQLVQGLGGTLNGSTRFDYTNYFETVPANKVETALWAEADRMRGLAITQDNLDNQKAVVENEVKVNVINQPYGGFPWLDVPQYANSNWYNAHNFYGDFAELDAATLADVQSFFDTYYAPNNAVVVVVGDVDPKATLELVQRYFGNIARREQPPRPDIAEPRQTEEKHATRTDALAPRPALAIAYHVPDRGSPEWYAMGLIDEILLQGEDSRLSE